MIKECVGCSINFICHNHFAKYCTIDCRNNYFLSLPFVCKVHGTLKDNEIVTNYKGEYVGRTCKHCKKVTKIKCRQKNPQPYRNSSNLLKRNEIENIGDSYVRDQLVDQVKYYIEGINGIKRIGDLFPPEFLEVKRLHIRLKRMLKGGNYGKHYTIKRILIKND